MNTLQQKNLFRLSAVLYAKTNDKISIKQIHRKIIEDALFCKGDSIISASALISYINSAYALLFSTREIEDIITSPHNKNKFIYSYKNNEIHISLTEEYKNKLNLKSQDKNLVDFIDEFICEKGYNNEIKEMILHFFYAVFTSNLNGFKRLLNEGTNGLEIGENYNTEEKIIINSFLQWENLDKDKAIFDLANYSLEYCIMTNSRNTEFSLDNLKNKNFYLDTNIIYRALGLNGQELKERTLLFLSKFKDVNENLLISYSTDHEFKDTIDYYIGKLTKYENPRIRSKVIYEFLDPDSIYQFYHQWSIGRSNRSVEYFRMYLLSEYDKLCKTYEIEIDSNFPYEEKKAKDLLEEYRSGINNYSDKKSLLSAEYDAKNILWVEERRKDKCTDIFDTKSYFLSSDKTLYNWDYTRQTHRIPVVMLATQWLNIILHYLERTNDDYRSFVCFLSMKINNPILSEDEIISIVSGISEIADDIETQRFLIKNYIETEAKGEMLVKDEEELEKSAKQYAESVLSIRILELEQGSKTNEEKLSNADRKIKDQDLKISKLSEEVKQMKSNVQKTSNANQEKDKEIIALKKADLRKWKILKVATFTIIAIFMIYIMYLMFEQKDWEYNYVWKLIQTFDKQKESVVSSVAEMIIVFPLTIFLYCSRMIYDAFNTHIDSRRKFWRVSH
ncbi:hypothetical protein [Prevotella melaninogenica]|uniref:hypothetical protein n=1 Tax=Prevotella melaninogenica TaxID=28132 RepID=UPI001C5E8EAF|nr:hypothetical protein [Prevotella melaninogenica]MBW4734215.1 hypothetical protein [Prevotella melaninogenica]MBW4736704.1 hypothetical protein [Prevotella melaninogenica]MBW4879317.1 hypothetical protein [Prevotella melaninogenica]